MSISKYDIIIHIMMVFIHPFTLLNKKHGRLNAPSHCCHAAARRHGGFHEELARARCAETWRPQLAPQQLQGGQNADGEVGIGAGIPGMVVQPRNAKWQYDNMIIYSNSLVDYGKSTMLNNKL